MKSAYDKIAAGFEDAIAYMEGDKSRGRTNIVDVRAIRTASKMSQSDFASAFGIPVATVRDWEHGRRRPESGSVTLLRMIAVDPAAVRDLIARA